MPDWLPSVLLVSWRFNYGAALPLQVDISKADGLLGWEPHVSVAEWARRCFAEHRNIS